MKKRLSLIAATALLATSTLIHADDQLCLTPYVGADAQFRHMNFKTNYGDNLFEHHSPQGNVYAGMRINDYLGIEAGYESSFRTTRTVVLGAGYISAGVPASPTTTSAQFTSTLRINGPHLNILGFFPISEEYRLKFVALAGIASLKANLQRRLNYTTSAGVTTTSNTVSTFENRKTVLRLGGGLEHMLTKQWGVRAGFVWENTARFQVPSTSPTSPRALVQTKNTTIYSLGAFFKF